MRLGMFMMPMHALGRNPMQTLREDRETVILADRLGLHDVFIGEHLTDTTENITNSMMFLATLIHATKTIKLATGTCNLSQSHPTLLAAQAAMFDHLAEGRFIFGISPGALPSDFEALGMLDLDRAKLFGHAIDVILEIWKREPPYDIDLPGNPFKVSTRQTYDPAIGIGIMLRPFQRPHPEIVGTVVAPHSKGVVLMGERDFHPMSANFLLAKWAKTHWANYAEGKRNVGQLADSPTRPIGAWRARCSWPTTIDWRAPTSTEPTAPTASTTPSCWPRSASVAARRSSRKAPTNPTPTSRSTRCWTSWCCTGRPRAWPTRCWHCANRSATLANWSTPAWTGSTRG